MEDLIMAPPTMIGRVDSQKVMVRQPYSPTAPAYCDFEEQPPTVATRSYDDGSDSEDGGVEGNDHEGQTFPFSEIFRFSPFHP